QTSVSLLSASRSTLVTVYATHWPSGERCGSRTSRKRSRSSTLSGRFSAACVDGAAARRDASSTGMAPAAGLLKRRVRPGWLMAPRLDEAPCYPDSAALARRSGLEDDVAAARVHVDAGARVAAAVADHLALLHDRLGVGIVVDDVAAAHAGAGLE